MPDLSRVKDREKLKPGNEPHWHRIKPGCFVGYVAPPSGGEGTWRARAYDRETGRKPQRSLGDFADLPGNERFAAAKREAEAFAELIDPGGRPDGAVETVADAARAYVKAMTPVDPAAGADADTLAAWKAASRKAIATEARFRRYLYSEPLAKVRLDKLRRRHLTDWRAQLEAKPALVSRSKSKKGSSIVLKTRPRSPATVNRDVAMLRAGLYRTLAPGAPNTDAAWQEALAASRDANGRRTLYLDKRQRVALLGAISDEARPFVSALCLLPLRPGAVAALSARDYDRRTHELTIGQDKGGHARRVLLPTDAAKLFDEGAQNKLPTVPLFRRANGKCWDKDTWKLKIAEAARAAKLPAAVTAYTLRHSTITDLVAGGLPLLTVAEISGTSAAMIEKHYSHLNREAAQQALAGLAL